MRILAVDWYDAAEKYWWETLNEDDKEGGSLIGDVLVLDPKNGKCIVTVEFDMIPDINSLRVKWID